MAIGKIEPTGCVMHKGKVQLRFNFYLEPSDPRYEEHHVQVPILPPEGYSGGVDEEGLIIDSADYESWLEGLPKEWQTNPFHIHFVYVDIDATDAEIKGLLNESLEEFFGIWAKGEDILEAWRTKPLKSKKRFVAGDMSQANLEKCRGKVDAIICRVSDFDVIIASEAVK